MHVHWNIYIFITCDHCTNFNGQTNIQELYLTELRKLFDCGRIFAFSGHNHLDVIFHLTNYSSWSLRSFKFIAKVKESQFMGFCVSAYIHVCVKRLSLCNLCNRKRFSNKKNHVSIPAYVLLRKEKSISFIKFLGRQYDLLTRIMEKINFCYSLQVKADFNSIFPLNFHFISFMLLFNISRWIR